MRIRLGSEMMLPRQSFEATCLQAGEFVYVRKLHPKMTGVVIVSPS